MNTTSSLLYTTAFNSQHHLPEFRDYNQLVPRSSISMPVSFFTLLVEFSSAMDIGETEVCAKFYSPVSVLQLTWNRRNTQLTLFSVGLTDFSSRNTKTSLHRARATKDQIDALCIALKRPILKDKWKGKRFHPRSMKEARA